MNIFRERSLKVKRLAGDWMPEVEREAVQCLPGKAGILRVIKEVTEQRMPDGGHVHADLVCAAGA